MINLRASQSEILTYERGMLGISAVPGSGKTWTLSLLAAQILLSGSLADDQEVLIVTLVNSAVDNFYHRVGSFIRQFGLLPNIGFRVRTLHGLAHDIVRERPELLGLDENFQIIDERESTAIINDIARTWLTSHPTGLDTYIKPDLDEYQYKNIQEKQLPELVQEIALSFIRYAKDLRLTPDHLSEVYRNSPISQPLAQMGCEIYADYQRALAYRGAVDFDDLIRLALNALQWDSRLLDRLRYRWPYVLEDEAQDSSLLQEQILRTLAGEDGNWVRVGDPNQAIYETFTTASPKYLLGFIQSTGVQRRELAESGRSAAKIINLANFLVRWTQNSHPNPPVRDALQAPPYIEQTSSDDPQPNPANHLANIQFVSRKLTPNEEVVVIANSLEQWLPSHSTDTVAVLAPRNQRAFDLEDELKRRGISFHSGLLRSSSETRQSAGALGNILLYLSDPGSSRKLSRAYQVWQRIDRGDDLDAGKVENASEILRKCTHTEDFIWPTPARDWLETSQLSQTDISTYQSLSQFRAFIQRWQNGVLLPIDQLVLILSQDLLKEPAELATAHKLAILLHQFSQHHPAWRLPEFANELGVIARNQRRFLGFSSDDTGFDPDRYKGTVVLSTIHKAKGLEWDRVYLMSVNNYDFPSGAPADQFISEKYFVRDRLNLGAETIAQLKNIITADEYHWVEEGTATLESRLDYIRERLRLLYVGITRAKKELIVSWNTGRRGDCFPAAAFIALNLFLEEQEESNAL